MIERKITLRDFNYTSRYLEYNIRPKVIGADQIHIQMEKDAAIVKIPDMPDQEYPIKWVYQYDNGNDDPIFSLLSTRPLSPFIRAITSASVVIQNNEMGYKNDVNKHYVFIPGNLGTVITSFLFKDNESNVNRFYSVNWSVVDGVLVPMNLWLRDTSSIPKEIADYLNVIKHEVIQLWLEKIQHDVLLTINVESDQ